MAALKKAEDQVEIDWHKDKFYLPAELEKSLAVEFLLLLYGSLGHLQHYK